MDTPEKGARRAVERDPFFLLRLAAWQNAGAKDIEGYRRFVEERLLYAAVEGAKRGDNDALAEILHKTPGMRPLANLFGEGHYKMKRVKRGRPAEAFTAEDRALVAGVDLALSFEALEAKMQAEAGRRRPDLVIGPAGLREHFGFTLAAGDFEIDFTDPCVGAATLLELLGHPPVDPERISDARHGNLREKHARALPLLRREEARRDLRRLSLSLAALAKELRQEASETGRRPELRINAIVFFRANFGVVPPGLGKRDEIDISDARKAAVEVLSMAQPLTNGRKTTIWTLRERWLRDRAGG